MPIRVAICDDSPLLRRVLRDVLEAGGLQVTAEYDSGDALVADLDRLRVDVITLDVEMPGRDGIATLREVMERRPGPVVMVSALTARGARLSLKAIGIGAIDVVEKPKTVGAGADWDAMCERLLQTVRAAAAAQVRPRLRSAPAPRHTPPAPSVPAASGRGAPLVIIAASTGGPRALESVLRALPDPLGCGTLLVQHMPPGFTEPLAERLDDVAALSVREAATPMAIAPGQALLARAGTHLEVVSIGQVTPSDRITPGRLRPRADVTIETAVDAYGSRVVLAVLTGMGNDGLAGARAVRAAGGTIICESAESCVVYGMPRAVVDAGLADHVAPLGEIPSLLCGATRGRR